MSKFDLEVSAESNGNPSEKLSGFASMEIEDDIEIDVDTQSSPTAEYVIEQLDSLANVDSRKLYDELIESSRFDLVIKNRFAFPFVTADEIAEIALEKNQLQELFSDADFFAQLDKNRLVAHLLRANHFVFLVQHLPDFSKDLQETIIRELVLQCHDAAFIRRTVYLPSVDKKMLFDALLQSDHIAILADELEQFPQDVDKQALLEKLKADQQFGAILGNVQAFGNIDQKGIVIEAIKTGQARQVLNNFYELSGVTTGWVQEQLIANGCAEWLVYRYNLFRKISSPEKLKNILLENNKIYAVFINPELFSVRLGGENDWLLEALMSERSFDVVLENRAFFGSVDYKKIIESAQGSQEFLEVAGCAHYFPIEFQPVLADRILAANELPVLLGTIGRFRAINTQKVLDACIESKMYDGIFKTFNAGFDFDIESYIHMLLADPDISFEHAKQLLLFEDLFSVSEFRLLVNMIDENWPSKIVSELIKFSPSKTLELLRRDRLKRHAVIRTLNQSKDYRGLLVLIKYCDLDAYPIAFEYPSILSEITDLVRNKNLSHASYLVECGVAVFPERENELRAMLSGYTGSEARESKKRERYQTIKCEQEILRYYVSVLFKNKFFSDKFPPKVRESIDRPITVLFEKLKEYVFLAVSGESSHSADVFLPSFGNKNDLMYRVAPDEDIRMFFVAAQENFSDRWNFRGGVGGELWKKIASFGERLWSADVQDDVIEQAAMVNLVIWLQHNGGTFFDKDKRVEYSDKLQELLDFEASGDLSLYTLLNFGVQNQIISKEESELLMNLWHECEKLEKDSGPINPNSLYLRSQRLRVEQALKKIKLNEQLPHEIRLLTQSVYYKETGFVTSDNSFHQLARLVTHLSVDWQQLDQHSSVFTNGVHEVYLLDIGGFDMAFWYKDGNLQDTKDLKKLMSQKRELSEVFGQQIVRAQFGYVREGD
ncbi:hypothetical protein KBC79_04165 [Candidatus Woesebacteria bacterium]|nr:hypothetical protein [Candidatus Woesebacteria bacterium]